MKNKSPWFRDAVGIALIVFVLALLIYILPPNPW